MRRGLHRLPEELLYRLIDEIRGMPLPDVRHHPLLLEMAEMASVPPTYIFDFVSAELPHLDGSDNPFLFKSESVRKSLAESFPYKILYLPTYRRIEEELDAAARFPGRTALSR